MLALWAFMTMQAQLTQRDVIMAIGNAVKRGNMVHIYDEKGRLTVSLAAGSGPNDGLKGYTSSTVNIQRGNQIFSYDEQGRMIGATSAR